MKLLKIVSYLSVFLIIWIGVHTLYTVYDGLTDREQKADIALVFGNTVNHDGTLSMRLRQRVDQALKLYQSGRVNHILVSGGLGKEGHYEAEKMKEYLIQNGIPERDIIVDNVGNTTRASVQNAQKFIEQEGLGSVIVVSQYFHITRIKMLFLQEKFRGEISGSSPWYFEWRDIYSILREYIAYYKQLIDSLI